MGFVAPNFFTRLQFWYFNPQIPRPTKLASWRRKNLFLLPLYPFQVFPRLPLPPWYVPYPDPKGLFDRRCLEKDLWPPLDLYPVLYHVLPPTPFPSLVVPFPPVSDATLGLCPPSSRRVSGQVFLPRHHSNTPTALAHTFHTAHCLQNYSIFGPSRRPLNRWDPVGAMRGDAPETRLRHHHAYGLRYVYTACDWHGWAQRRAKLGPHINAGRRGTAVW